MIHSLKRRLYFIVATYFALFARIVLWRWKPRIIVITGSTGKTTLLHLVEAQLGSKAEFTHHANSSFGIPFHILGLHPNVDSKLQWPLFILRAPLQVFRKLPQNKLYVVEADCDRPNEGKFLSKLLKPEVTMWISVFRTHSMNFDRLVYSREFTTHEQAIAYEFGNFAERTTKLVLANGDQPHLVEQLKRVPKNAEVKKAAISNLKDYRFDKDQTIFEFKKASVHLPGLHPKEIGISVQMVYELMNYLDLPRDEQYKNLEMPPGRSSVFAGKKDTTIVDSTYNTGLGAMTAIIKLFAQYPNEHKWLIIGDILEQGSLEKSEHKKLAEVILEQDAERVVLLGPRTRADTLPLLQKKLGDAVVSFESPKEVLDYLNENLQGTEALLFKGGRFLEGVIEQLLADPKDADKLVRRSKAWTKRRQKWGLPR